MVLLGEAAGTTEPSVVLPIVLTGVALVLVVAGGGAAVLAKQSWVRYAGGILAVIAAGYLAWMWHNQVVNYVRSGLENLAEQPVNRLLVAATFGGIGIWLMLPAKKKWVRRSGGVLSVIGGCFLFSVLPPIGDYVVQGMFWSLAALTTVAAVATITSRNPVYSAIWFAMTLLGVGGLFLVNGAQFLAVATVAVYAGAIVVTFLFVLMLSQPEGHAYYDRISWGTLPSIFGTLAGIGFIVLTVAAVVKITPIAGGSEPAEVVAKQTLEPQHVAALGAQLFSRQLVAVQVAGALLLAALVGAVAIAQAGKPRFKRPGGDGFATGASKSPLSSAGAVSAVREGR
jgi:NADH-quinone oxidoreductase subunit J